MVTKRIRSEYMKKFKDPKWETYSRCYDEMLKYRLTRRLLEHTHNPWFWSGSDSDSDSGGRSPPPANKNQVGAETDRDRTQAESVCDLERTDRPQQQDQQTRTAGPVPRLVLQQQDQQTSTAGPVPRRVLQQQQDQQTRTTGPVPRLVLQQQQQQQQQQEEEDVSVVHGSQLDVVREARVPEEQRGSSRGSKHPSVPHREQGPQPQSSKPAKSSKQTWRCQRVRPASSLQPRQDNDESRHPFALYGSGEKDADIAGRKTHNVRPAASTNEIHESALRARTRREVERQIQTQRSERRRAKSADLNKARNLVQPEFNPWLTEYMRCFSARCR